MMEISFENKVVIITGGSRGIGKAIVHAFCNTGAKVYFTYLTNNNEANNVILQCNNAASAHQVDGREYNQIKQFIDTVAKEHGKIDILVNNAGVIHQNLLANTNYQTWDEIIKTNLNSIYSYCNLSLKYLSRSSSGAIINISSLAADKPTKGSSAYSATKGAIESFSKALAIEYAPFNIRVNTVAPGLIETDIANKVSDKLKNEILNGTPLKRMGIPEDVSNAVLFLASSKASFITGTKLYVTGGRHIK